MKLLVAVGVLLGLPGSAGPSATQRINVAPVVAVTGFQLGGPTLSFYAMSPWTESDVNMSPQRLDSFFEAKGSRYSIESNDGALVSQLARLLGGVDFHESELPAESADLRYRIVVTDKGQSILRVYVAADGRVVYEGKVLQPTASAKDWLRRFWKLLRADERYGPFGIKSAKK